MVEEFQTSAGHPAIGIRRIRPGAPRENGRLAVNTGQAQVLVVYREARALGVVSGACRDPRDLNATAALVAGLVARMTVTAAATGDAVPGNAPGDHSRHHGHVADRTRTLWRAAKGRRPFARHTRWSEAPPRMRTPTRAV